MQRLNKNTGGYFGETINISAVLEDIKAAAQENAWSSETFLANAGVELLALRRSQLSTLNPQLSTRIYLSTGIHGDEPAGPLAMRQLIQENRWPENVSLWLCPCLNPAGFKLNRRENAEGRDLNRDYRHFKTAEVRAHVQWLERQPAFDVTFCLHEDWESHGFYLYELNPEHHPSPSRKMIEAVAAFCPIDLSPVIEGREAGGGLINPNLDPASRPEWPEAFWLLQNKTRLSYTLEAPSDFPLSVRVAALVAGVNAALASLT